MYFPPTLQPGYGPTRKQGFVAYFTFSAVEASGTMQFTREQHASADCVFLHFCLLASARCLYVFMQKKVEASLC